MEKELKDSVLVRFQKGDARAFQEVFDFYYDNIFYFVYKLLDSKEDAEDVSMQIFDKLFRMHTQFETAPNIKAFLFISARNLSFNYIRANNYRQEREKKFAIEMENEDQFKLEYDVRTDLLDAIHRAAKKLPGTCRRVFQLIFLDNLETIEVAQQLNISVENVRNQKKRALQILKLELGNTSALLALLYLLLTFSVKLFLLFFYVLGRYCVSI